MILDQMLTTLFHVGIVWALNIEQRECAHHFLAAILYGDRITDTGNLNNAELLYVSQDRRGLIRAPKDYHKCLPLRRALTLLQSWRKISNFIIPDIVTSI